MGQNSTQIAHAGKTVSTANPLPVTDADAATQLSSIDANIDQLLTMATTGNGLKVVGSSVLATSTVTRAANQTPYTAGDVVGGVLTLANAGVSGMDTLITAIRMMLNITAKPVGMTNFSLHFYNTTPPSAIADNGVWTLSAADSALYIGHIDGLTPAELGIGTVRVQAQLSQLLEQYRLVGGTNLFAYLVTNGGYTPAANSETYTLAARGIVIG